MTKFDKAILHLKTTDPILGRVIDQIELPDRNRAVNYFESLTESIVSQQLSIKAVDTIFTRFIKLFGDLGFPTQKEVLAMPDEKIRSCGISYQKISYIKDLAQKTDEKLIDLDTIAELTDEKVILRLTEIKGIGKWTAEMFLMFALSRPDVFSYGDLGLRTAIKKLYSLKKYPSEKKAKQISDKWKPYRTLACRYLWSSLELSR